MAAAVLIAACGGGGADGTARVRSVLTGAPAPAQAGAGLAAASDSTTTPAPPPRDDPALPLPDGDTIQVDSAVAAFYHERGYSPVWTDGSGLRPAGRALVAALSQSGTDGLAPHRYGTGEVSLLEQRIDAADDDERPALLGDLDLLLSQSFVHLARDLDRGTMDAEEAGLEWRIPRGDPALSPLLRRAAESGPAPVLDSLRPRAPEYRRMREALSRLRDIARAGGWGTVPSGPPLSEGDHTARVAALRRRLAAGADPVERRLARAGRRHPERFDADLAKALRHFQDRHTLLEDGTLGPRTTAALNVPVSHRIETLRLNLDRWRWLPEDLGETYLMVNVAGFELEVIQADTVVESMDVVVGRTANRTPIFQDTLESMVVNPYWNVPPTIAEKEILPEAERDPTYLARNHFDITQDGDRLRVRQRPGPWNALGHVKFLFPNDHNIYLHDTPADHLFSQKTRAFSHGCIRLQRPDELAHTLLRLTGRDPGDYDRLRRTGEEKWVKFERRIPVYIVYFTAWVGESGELRFHPDVYARDRSLSRQLAARLGPDVAG